MRDKVEGILLLSAAVGLSVIGIGYLTVPHTVYGFYDIAIQSANELNMVRGAYGGLFLSVSVLLWIGFFNASLRQNAIVTLFVFMAGFAVGRFISLMSDGVPSVFILMLLGMEILYAIGCAWLLRRD